MKTEVEHYIVSGDLEIRVREPIKHRREEFWPWEYWAIKEHMASCRCSTLGEYVSDVLMSYWMPNRRDTTEPEIDDRPPHGEPTIKNIIVRIPMKVMEAIDARRKILGRTWREYMLYPAKAEKLIDIHYKQLTGKSWPLGDVE